MLSLFRVACILPVTLFCLTLLLQPKISMALQTDNAQSGKETPSPDETILEQVDEARRQRNFDKAKRLLDDGIKQYPKSAKLYLERARYYEFMIRLQPKFSESAKNDYSKVIQLDRPNHESWGHRAAFNMRLGKYDEAIQDLTEAIARAKFAPGYYINRAQCYQWTGELEKSNADNRAVIAMINAKPKGILNPFPELTDGEKNAHFLAHMNNVTNLLGLDQFKEAIKFGEQAEKLARRYNINNPEVYYNRGLAYLAYADEVNQHGDHLDKAEKDFNAIPNPSMNVFTRRGRVYHLRNEFREADRYFNSVYTAQWQAQLPIDEYLAYHYPATLEELGSFIDAVTVIEQAIKTYPKKAYFEHMHAKVQMQRGLIAEAKAILQNAIENHPENVDLLGALGIVHLREGKRDMAFQQQFKPMLQKLDAKIQQEPKNARLVRYKAYMGRMAGLHGASIKHYRDALKINEDDLYSKDGLARMLIRNPKGNEADWNEALKLSQNICQATNNKSGTFLDTKACAEARLGKFNDAVASEKLAIEHLRNRYKQKAWHHLADFEAGLPAQNMIDPYYTDEVKANHKYTPVPRFECIKNPNNPVLQPKQILEKYKESVVILKSDYGVGTGTVIDPSGYILTCAHVLPRTGNLNVLYYVIGQNGEEIEKSVEAEVRLMDLRNDLGLIKTLKPLPVKAAPLGDPKNKPARAPGDNILCVGNPGVGQQVLPRNPFQGIVAQTRIALPDKREYLQVNAGVQQGCSGGPVFDERGHIIGVVVQISGRALTFAVPLEEVRTFLGLKQ